MDDIPDVFVTDLVAGSPIIHPVAAAPSHAEAVRGPSPRPKQAMKHQRRRPVPGSIQATSRRGQTLRMAQLPIKIPGT